jgi:signal peptidase I
MIFYWLFSTTVRDAVAMRKHVYRMFCAQRDLMTPTAIQLVSGALLDLQKGLEDHVDKAMLKKYMVTLEVTAGKWLRPYPHAGIRENVEVLLVALAVALAIRTFFLQPFKIPTGSMQPTLYGVTSKNLLGDSDFKIPTGWARVKEWFEGISYVHVIAQADGPVDSFSPMRRLLIFNIKQTLTIGGVEHTIWFPPDYGESQIAGMDPFVYRARLFEHPDHVYHKGEDVVKLQVKAGDHLFVDRLTYNFRKPDRGDIIVFETAGIPEKMRHNPPYWDIPDDEFYIKRLVALPGEKVSIGNDRHLRINGMRLDASTPHFENVYGFDPDKPPHDSQYSGHLNGTVAQEYNFGNLPQFPNEETIYDVPANACMPMGDNTCSSLDSRFWGAIPEKYVIGKSFFVYWPITERFGIGHWSTAQ